METHSNPSLHINFLSSQRSLLCFLMTPRKSITSILGMNLYVISSFFIAPKYFVKRLVTNTRRCSRFNHKYSLSCSESLSRLDCFPALCNTYTYRSANIFISFYGMEIAICLSILSDFVIHFDTRFYRLFCTNST